MFLNLQDFGEVLFLKLLRINPEVTLDHLYIDNATMTVKLCRPTTFDVIVTGNIFGDIFLMKSSQLTGSIGMSPIC